MSERLKRCWSQSKLFRVALVVALLYVLARAIVQGIFLAMPFLADNVAEQFIPDDLRIYLDAAERFRGRQDLYLKGPVDTMEFYQYPPAFALLFTAVLWLPRPVVAVAYTLVHIAVYWFLYLSWQRIFGRLGFERAVSTLAWTLPVWLVFTAFWDDLIYLNVYIITPLLATLLIESILNERLGWSVLWLALILQIKPHWAFAAALPLLLGRYRFFLELLAWTGAASIAVVGLTILIAGPGFAWQQHVDYAQLLSTIQKGQYPWRGPDEPFMGYNQSITQTVVYWLGISPETLLLAKAIKIVLLVPLAWQCLRSIIYPVKQIGRDVPQFSLDMAFALYLGTFIWLDVIWELSLGIAVFTYLAAWKKLRGIVSVTFVPYAVVDFWRLLTLAILGTDVISPGLYMLTDPTIYVPVIMVVILVFYGILVKRLWHTNPQTAVESSWAESRT